MNHPYPDDILHDLSKDFDDVHKAILLRLACDIRDSDAVLLDWNQIHSRTGKQLEESLDLSYYTFRPYLSFLTGARMIEVQKNPINKKEFKISLTANGYRFVQMQFGN